jgi:hypothetical protein
MKRIMFILVCLSLMLRSSVIRSEGPWTIYCDVQPEVEGYFASLDGGPILYIPKTVVTLSDGSQATLLMKVPIRPFSIWIVAYNYWGFSEPVFMSFVKLAPPKEPPSMKPVKPIEEQQGVRVCSH